VDEHIICEKCGWEITRLETYIEVNGITLCDECYMNMSTKDFIELIGGIVAVKE
jgi:hypothetical protein